MEVLDWDIYAKSYDDTQHLIGRPDLAQQHYDMIGREQGRDAGFDAVLVYCTSEGCDSEESARAYYLGSSNPHTICRSKKQLVQRVAQSAELINIPAQGSEYILDASVDEAIFSLYLERSKKSLLEVVGTIVQRMTEELISDVALKGGQVPKSALSVPQPQSAQRVAQRPAAVRIEQLREFLVELDCVVPIEGSDCLLMIGIRVDPDRQIKTIRLMTEQRRVDIGQAVVVFSRPARAQTLSPQVAALVDEHAHIGFGVLVRLSLLKDQTVTGLEIESTSGTLTQVHCEASALDSIQPEDLQCLWQQMHGVFYSELEGKVEQLPARLLQAVLPEKVTPNNPLQFDINALYAFEGHQLLFATLRDPQFKLRGLYRRQGHGGLDSLESQSVRGLAAPDALGPQEFFLANSPDTTTFSTAVSFLGLLEDGQWFRIDRLVQTVTAEQVLRDLVRCFNRLQGPVADQVYSTIVNPIVDALFAPQVFKNPAYQLQLLGHIGQRSGSVEYSVLIHAKAANRRLLAQLSQLADRGRAGQSQQGLEVLVYLEEVPAAGELQAYLAQLEWFGCDLQVLSAPVQQGYGRTMNQLANQSRGKHLLFLNDGVLPSNSDFLVTLSQHLHHGSAGVAVPLALNPGNTIHNAGYAFLRETSTLDWSMHNTAALLPARHAQTGGVRTVQCGSFQAAMVSKAGFDRLGGFAEHLQDIELCSIDYSLRVGNLQKTVLLDPTVVCHVLPPSNPPEHADQGRSMLLKRYQHKVLNSIVRGLS